MKNNEKDKNELNYKEAYYYLFNRLTYITGVLQSIQRNAEDICISDPKNDGANIDVEEMMKGLIEKFKIDKEE